MSRVLVTGIEGFAGRHLAALLADTGHTVSGIHLAPPPTDPRLRLYEADIRDLAAVRRAVTDCRPERVVHLAAVSSVAESENAATTTFEVNALGTLKLFEALRLAGLAPRVLVISSANVYGPAVSSVYPMARPPAPLTEDAAIQPLSPYALSKLACEQVGRYYRDAHGFDVVTLRPFSHTGPGQSPSFVFSSAARRIAALEHSRDNTGGRLEMGNLEVRRDYTDVRDIVRAYALALDRCDPGSVFNITSGRPVLLRDAIETMVRLARCPITVVTATDKLRPRDLPVLTGDPSRFHAATDWETEIPFEQTLADLLDYWRQQPPDDDRQS
ncbi:MAG TPA: NAD-dependent epimerase/dehydratase family protein [candidate division WOR-3 bacterium]|uniref:NAD-dependent epimerase/dehydratase family protein n=1 Tax=candidate division WOR-3 bacterium TaxID=2052148 RepID=A0A7V0T7U9_UNCW3|nr:NAD-dependent epimerase/dehydratase family protein [candidate division WOR-3 bacterium]